MSTRTVTRQYTWAMAHRLQYHPGPCRFLHGHNYMAEVEVEGRINGENMVMDFGHMKTLQEYIDRNWDHATMLRHDDPLVEVLKAADQRVAECHLDPTAEYIAAILAQTAAALLVAKSIHIRRVSVYETPKLAAHWYR